VKVAEQIEEAVLVRRDRPLQLFAIQVVKALVETADNLLPRSYYSRHH